MLLQEKFAEDLEGHGLAATGSCLPLNAAFYSGVLTIGHGTEDLLRLIAGLIRRQVTMPAQFEEPARAIAPKSSRPVANEVSLGPALLDLNTKSAQLAVP